MTAVVYRDADPPAWFRLPTFTFVAIAISVAPAWLRLRTDSVWPGTFLHASHNLWMQSIFFPLTSEHADTKWSRVTPGWRSWRWPWLRWRSGSSATH